MAKYIRTDMLKDEVGPGVRETRDAGGTIPARAFVKLSGQDVVVAGVGDVACGASTHDGQKVVGASVRVVRGGEVTVSAAVAIGEEEPVKVYASGEAGPAAFGDLLDVTIDTGVGLAFANQPTNDGVEIVSSSASDTQTMRVYGTTFGGTTVVVEDVVLTGTTFVPTVKVDWGEILGVEIISGGLAVGTITVREASGNATITTLSAGEASKGIVSVPSGDQRAFNRKVFASANGATTKIFGVVGQNSSGNTVRIASALTGATQVEMSTALLKVTKLLVGDVESSRTVTVKTTNQPDSATLVMGYARAAIAAGKNGTIWMEPLSVHSVAEMPAVARKTKKFIYSFASDGGAVGAITLKDENGDTSKLPADACIASAFYEVVAAPTSGGAATIALGYTGNDNAFLAALAYNDAALALDKFVGANAELPIKVTSEVSVLLTVATAALTAGVIHVTVEYFQGS